MGYKGVDCSSSLVTLPDTTNMNDDVRHVSRDWKQQRDVPSVTPHDASATRTYGAPPLHAAEYEHDRQYFSLGAQPSADLGIVLEELSKRASRYCINLNKLIVRDKTFTHAHSPSSNTLFAVLCCLHSKTSMHVFLYNPSDFMGCFFTGIGVVSGKSDSSASGREGLCFCLCTPLSI
ncbi:hypothetical protein SCLCIDRAFT_229067 [Scleroderma citrinum Foug A]|uniref:Uncharacterized protein n=1 Tax=Scleroderma citrinum Foug A TaxID=1036808 RepID=A0A0C3EFV8_9AGAM|nr:hypothetical protein SCLCIDRAFT_229067 [Scleroderma citrinum Foug A]